MTHSLVILKTRYATFFYAVEISSLQMESSNMKNTLKDSIICTSM